MEDSQKTSGNWEDPYDAFLAGEGTVSIQYYLDNVFKDSDNLYLSYEDELIKNISGNTEYTLKEFYDALDSSFDTPGQVGTMSYAFLDCGADGNKELAIKVSGPFVEPESDMTFVVKDMDGQLQVIYLFAEWSRSETTLYEYGELCGFGSGGASVHGWTEAFINAEGKYVFGYDYEEESDLDQFAAFKEHDDFDASNLEGTICVYTVRIVPYSEETKDDEYYSYSVYKDYGEKLEVPNLYTDSPYQKVMDSFKNISFLTADELDKLLNDHLDECGLTYKMDHGLELHYTEIDFDKEYVHDTTADKYRVTNNIQEELALVEEISSEYENMGIDNMPQQDAKDASYKWYLIWDVELNDLWSRITDEIDPDKKQALVEEQRNWVKRKEANVYEAGVEFEGGSMQPLLENSKSRSFTRKRCYELAGILAEIRGEDFQVPTAVAESYESVDRTLDEVFESFKGQWIFDESRGACIGVEKSEDTDLAPEGSTWTVWETGGDVISDLDVYSFTDDTITFKVPRDGYDSYYKLRFSWEGDVELIYGNSLEELYEQ